MPTGAGVVSKVHFKGDTDDFVVFVDSPDDLEKWKGDRSIPLSQVVNSFKIMVTHKHGAQGQMDEASKSSLQNEFGTSDENKCIVQILEKGDLQSTKTHEKGGDRNDTKGARQAHSAGNPS